MEAFCLRFFVKVLTVFLIYEVVFSKCIMKNKTHVHLIKSYVDGFQRNERQASIDPSRMYLPPKIDSVASSGFGEQIDTLNNFGGNSDGYGEIPLIQDRFSNSQSAEVSDYEVSNKTINDSSNADHNTGLYDLRISSESEKSPLSRNSKYSSLASGDPNFGRLSNINNLRNLPVTDNYGSSSGTTKLNNGITAQWGRTDNYGQNEQLVTAQNQGLTREYYNQVTRSNAFGQNLDFGNRYSQSTVQTTDMGYDNTASSPSISRNGGQKSYDRDNNGNIVPSESSQLSNYDGGYGNTLPYSNTQKPVNSDQRNPLLGTNNYVQQRPHSLGNEENYGRISTTNNGYNQNSLLNQMNGFNQGQQNLLISNSYGPPSSQMPENGEKIFLSASNIHTPDGYKKETLFIGTNDFSQSQTAVPNNYWPTNSQSSFSNRNNYDQNNDGYYQNALIKPQGGFNSYSYLGYQTFPLNKENYYQNLLTNSGYTQESSQNSNNLKSYNFGQNPSNRGYGGTTRLGTHGQDTSTSSGCNCDTSANKPQKLVYNKNGLTPPILGQISSSSTPSYEQGTKSSNRGNINLGTKSGCGVQKPKIHSTLVPKDQYQNSYLPGDTVFEKQPNGAYTPTISNGNFDSPGQNAFSNFAPGNQPNGANYIPTTTNNSDNSSPGPNAFSNFAPGNQPNGANYIPTTTNNSDNSSPGPNAFSNFAPGNQPNGANDIPTTTNNSDNSSPGPNAFSNFAPGNQPNGANDIPTTTNNSDNSSPGPNAFSNFAPGNQPNGANDIPTTTNNSDNNSPGPNAFSNFAPGNQPNGANDIPTTTNNSDNSSPGPNAFSNFAPGNQPNGANNTSATTTNNSLAITNNGSGLPGQNAFSNFAPGNQPIGANDTSATTNKGDFGSPGQNAFSNFAPTNQQNEANDTPGIINNGVFGLPGQNAFSNFAPGNQQNWVYDVPATTNNDDFSASGLNGLPSFTPENQHNQPNGPNYIPAITSNDDYGTPGLNSFSNFAPSNLPSQVINTGNNNCGKGNHGNNIESIFSTANTGY